MKGNIKKAVLDKVAKIALITAEKASGAASWWDAYQPKNKHYLMLICKANQKGIIMNGKLKKFIIAVTTACIVTHTPMFALNVNAHAFDISISNTENVQGVAIKNAKELMNMKSDGTYHLASDIDLSGVKWRCVRNFKGTFDGNGYEIKNLSSSTYGLFSSVGSNAVIKNVKLTNVDIKSKYKTVGAVVSVINSNAQNVRIDNCFVSGVVASCLKKYGKSSTGSTAGAIVGKNSSSAQ